MSSPPAASRPAIAGADDALVQAIHSSLDGLLAALRLEPLGDDRFRVVGEPGRFASVFGGQLVAQALLAAAATEPTKPAHSLHAYFVQAGDPGESLVVAVDRLRDGRSMSTRHVTVRQADRTLLGALVSFHANIPDETLGDPPPPMAPPAGVPLLQAWVDDAPEALGPQTRLWVEQPPPLELRIAEPPSFLGGKTDRAMRSHWMRIPRDVGDDPTLHISLLAYASDYLLLDMALRAEATPSGSGGYTALSLDHALWFHRPPRVDRWHLYTQRTRVLSGHRGLVEGTVHDEDGRVVATALQEVLIRPVR